MAKIGIIGMGKMGAAIAKSLKGHGHGIIALDTRKGSSNLARSLSQCDYVFLCTKPKDAKDALQTMKGKLPAKTVLVSIVAGMPLKSIQNLSSHKLAIRAMPNLGLVASKSFTCYAPSPSLSQKQVAGAAKLLSSLGLCIKIREYLMDSATAISGSGIAYFLYLAKHMQEAGHKFGFSKKEAASILKGTLASASAYANASDSSFDELLAGIATPGGTTKAALDHFDYNGTGKIIEDAARKAKERSRSIFSAKKK